MSSRSMLLGVALLALVAVGFGAWDAALGGEAKAVPGPRIGTRTTAFDVRGVTGMGKGTRLCYI